MCQFFSFVGDGHGNFRYHDWEDRQKIGVNADPGPDSHTLILTRLGIPVTKQDMWSTYEYSPLIKKFTIDNGKDGHDHEAARNWVESLDFKKVIPALRLKRIIHPLKIVAPSKISTEHLELLKVWASVWVSVRDSVWDSVGGSVWDSVRDSVWGSVWDSVWVSVGGSVRDSVGASVGASVWGSVWDSVRASVGAYYSSFIDVEHEYDFSSAIKLWELGLVPSYDGSVWRLHGGPNGNILWKEKL